MGCSHPSCVVHQLPEYARHGHPPSYEYPLPAQIEQSSLATLHPWIAHAATLTPANAHAYLETRWKGLRHPGLWRVRDHLLEYETRSIVLTGTRAWLLCVHENGGFNLVAPPLDGEFVRKQQSLWHVSGNSVLTDTLMHFGGLREDFAPSGGYFVGDDEWEGINQAEMETIKGYSEWKDSLIVFSSRGGDGLLLHPSGRVGWLVADEVRMRDAYENLETCLIDFVRYRRVPWPFDPYEPNLDFFRIVG